MTSESSFGREFEARNKAERRMLWIVLVINAVMFLVEGGAGLRAQSSGLLADSLDMASDAAMYAISLFAIGRSERLKAGVTALFGWSLILLAVGVVVDGVRRFAFGSEPESLVMILIGLLALAANITCLALLTRHRAGEVHLRAAYICSSNDVLANVGVMISGALVALLGSRWPDLLIGLVIALLVTRGGIQILREASAAGRVPVKVVDDGNCQDCRHD